MSIFHTGSGLLPGATSRNHCSKPELAMRAWNSSVSGADSSTSFLRTGELSHASMFAWLSKRRIATQLSWMPGTAGSKR